MSSSIGDTLNLLSTTTPLAANSTWTSSSVVLGQYNSLVIMVRSDADGTLFVDWSGDNGINFDASDNYNIVDNLTKRIVITTQQKVIRLRYFNGAANQSVFRLFTYGVVTNNSSLVSLVSEISIDNLIAGLLGSQTQVTQLTPITEYNFSNGSNASGFCFNNSNPTAFQDIQANANNNNISTWGIRNLNAYQNRYLFLQSGIIASNLALIQGRGHRLRGGETLTAKFISSFSVSDTTAGTLFFGICPTPGDTSRPAILPDYLGGAFGWYISGIKTNNNFSIIYGFGLTVPRTVWNLDKADGNSTLPLIDFTNADKPNLYQIEITAGGNLRFSIMNPSDNKLVPVHQVSILHNVLYNPQAEMCFTMYNGCGTGHTTGIDEVRCLSYTLLTDSPLIIPTAPSANISYDIAIPGGIVTSIALRNSPLNGGGTNYCHNPVNLTNISISTSGINPVTIQFILDAVVSGGVWNAPAGGSFSVPLQNNTTAVITTPSPASIIYQFELGAYDKFYKEFNPLTPFLYGYRPVAIRCSSKSTSDVRICLGLCS